MKLQCLYRIPEPAEHEIFHQPVAPLIRALSSMVSTGNLYSRDTTDTTLVSGMSLWLKSKSIFQPSSQTSVDVTSIGGTKSIPSLSEVPIYPSTDSLNTQQLTTQNLGHCNREDSIDNEFPLPQVLIEYRDGGPKDSNFSNQSAIPSPKLIGRHYHHHHNKPDVISATATAHDHSSLPSSLLPLTPDVMESILLNTINLGRHPHERQFNFHIRYMIYA